MTKYNSTQTQQLQEIGAYLRQKRLASSLSLEQVASSTFIRLPILKALEGGEVDQLPELIYVQGFLRRYGEALNLDGQALAKKISPNTEETALEIPAELVATGGSRLEPLGEDLSSPAIRTNTESLPENSPSTKEVIPQKPKQPSISPNLGFSKLRVYGLYFALLGGAVLGLFYVFSRPHSPQSTVKNPSSEILKQASTVAQKSPPELPKAVEETQPKLDRIVSSDQPSSIIEPVPTASPEVDATPQASPQPEPDIEQSTTQQPINNQESELVQTPVPEPSSPVTESQTGPVAAAVSLEEDSWMQVKIDGKTEYEGILKKGEQQSWTAQETLIIRVGNAGAVNLSVNNKPGEKLGELGEVKQVTLTPDG